MERKACKIKPDYLFSDVKIAGFSSFNIGGVAKFFAIPSKISHLKKALKFAKKNNLTPIVFGLGTNIIFPDEPSDRLIFISLRNLIQIKSFGKKTFLSAGIPSSVLSIIGILSDTKDLLFTHLLPGSVGGGIFMNARCYENDFCNILDKIYYLDDKFVVKTINKNKCNFSYKNSIFQSNNWIILGGEFNLNRGLTKKDERKIMEFVGTKKNFSSLDEFYNLFSIKSISNFFNINKIPEKVKEIEEDRLKKHHFDFPSCGSVFKNNYEISIPMGKLIEMTGLKGLTSGGAKISEFHGNFIINYAGATQKDVLNLMEIIKEKINENYGFIPEAELRVIND